MDDAPLGDEEAGAEPGRPPHGGGQAGPRGRLRRCDVRKTFTFSTH